MKISRTDNIIKNRFGKNIYTGGCSFSSSVLNYTISWIFVLLCISQVPTTVDSTPKEQKEEEKKNKDKRL